MNIPIVHKKRNLQYYSIIVTTFFALILLSIALFGSYLISMVSYQFIQIMAFSSLIIYLIFVLFIFFSKKYKEIGTIVTDSNSFKIIRGTGEIQYKPDNISDIRLIINSYQGQRREECKMLKEDGLGNFLVFAFRDKTYIHELYLRDFHTLKEFVFYFNKTVSNSQIIVNKNLSI